MITLDVGRYPSIRATVARTRAYSSPSDVLRRHGVGVSLMRVRRAVAGLVVWTVLAMGCALGLAAAPARASASLAAGSASGAKGPDPSAALSWNRCGRIGAEPRGRY